MNHVEFWTRIYSLTDKYDLLRHPFYEAWRDGKLTLEDLREYACEYYHQVFSFPVYLKTLADRLPDGELRQVVLRNLSDELGMQDEPRRAHDLLWVDFAVGTGATAKDVLGRRPIHPITVLLRTFVELARRGTPAEAIASFYVYESQTPKIAKQKANALQKIYARRGSMQILHAAFHGRCCARHGLAGTAPGINS
jgi:pyrroloquinoline-quinone synthase